MKASRRELLAGLFGLAAAGPRRAGAALLDAAATPKPFAPRIGYAAITWNGNDRQAIGDVSAVGFRGIQLRTSVLKEFEHKHAELRRLLDDSGIKLRCICALTFGRAGGVFTKVVRA